MNLLPAVTVNYTAVLAAAVAAMAVGYIWYGPLFGKTWIKLTGAKEMGNKNDMPKTYVIQFVASVVTAYVLAAFLGLTGTTGLTGALMVAFWAWLGFQAVEKVGVVLWEGKSWNLFFLGAAGQLVTILVMAAVLSYLK
ncbi:MAG TPA: DUF1761 domain-containing protein [Patescibacteria group bacterium]|nr:DUF1761 domain-containing protein [Patescibacteria group bacterium]